MSKKILIINGSPRANGNTESIIDSFIKGAEGTEPFPTHEQKKSLDEIVKYL